MRFSTALSALLVALPLVAAVPAAPKTLVAQKATPAAKGGAAASASAASAASASAASASATGAAAAAGNGATDDPDTSLCLDPSQVLPGLANDGLNGNAESGEVASATTVNNFINNCLHSPTLPLTNGLQILTGSCNPVPIGVIPAKTNIPASKILFPLNFATIQSNTSFVASMNIINLNTGHFTNADATYYGAPQFVNTNGNIDGHSHLTIQKINGLQDTTPPSAAVFAFFKGLNSQAQGGVLTANVTGGLPAGTYRICTINTSANHVPVVAPVAQHGGIDDCSYFTVSDNPADVTNSPSAGGQAVGAASSSGSAAGSAAAGAAGAAAGGAAGAAAGGAANAGAAAGASASKGAAASQTSAAAASAASASQAAGAKAGAGAASATSKAGAAAATGGSGSGRGAAVGSNKGAAPNRFGGGRFGGNRGGRNRRLSRF